MRVDELEQVAIEMEYEVEEFGQGGPLLGRARRRGGDRVANDDERFARFDHAEIAAGRFLDGRRIVLQTAALGEQVLVFEAQDRDLGRQLGRLVGRAHGGEIAAITHDRVDEQRAQDDREAPADNAAPAFALFGRGRTLASPRRDG